MQRGLFVITARALMQTFAERTGLASDRPEQRYLWTDAFAVQNFLALGEHDLARALVEHVHRTLGRAGGKWLSPEGEARPTLGGLRIGKDLPERTETERFDPELEWDRDGQYFHYLTKWMRALHAFGDETYERQALDLARTARRAFVHGGRMYWKMSVDLSRPLVSSMGQHDPLDGLVTHLVLGEETSVFDPMVETLSLETDDPLGIGGLYSDAQDLAELGVRGPLRKRVLAAAEEGLRTYLAFHEPRGTAERRLAFRELGLAIGLERVHRHRELASGIVAFWSSDEHRRADSYRAHENINDVMLATALLGS